MKSLSAEPTRCPFVDVCNGMSAAIFSSIYSPNRHVHSAKLDSISIPFFLDSSNQFDDVWLVRLSWSCQLQTSNERNPLITNQNFTNIIDKQGAPWLTVNFHEHQIYFHRETWLNIFHSIFLNPVTRNLADASRSAFRTMRSLHSRQSANLSIPKYSS